MKSLLTEVRNCSLCKGDLPHGVRPVLQVNPKARILIAGQAPGRKVHESGVPFDDASGNRLRDWMGIEREVFYDESKIAIVPMALCYPGTGKSGDLPPPKICADTWKQRLLSLLSEIDLTLIIGQYAMAYHLPNEKGNVTDKVMSWRNYFPESLPHPSPRNNIWLKKNSWFEQDVLPALKNRVKQLVS